MPGPGFEGQVCWADFVEKSSVVVPCLFQDFFLFIFA